MRAQESRSARRARGRARALLLDKMSSVESKIEFDMGQTCRSVRHHRYLLGQTRIGKKKAAQVIWHLAESQKQCLQENMQSAKSLMLARDEGHNHLHVRFRACNDGPRLKRTSGFLGQVVGGDPSSLGITKGTIDVIRSFCTRYENLPPGAAADTAPRPQLQQKLFDLVNSILEAIASDSASNEITACHDIQIITSIQSQRQLKRFWRNLKFILRDACHNARRVLSRPWKADKTLDGLMDLFALGKRSLAQMVTQPRAI